MDLTEINLLTQYTRIIRYWWLLTIATILGGCLGWLFSLAQPPMYDAKASIVVTVDFSQTGNLTAYNLDMAVGAIQSVFYSHEVLSQVQTTAIKLFTDIETDDLNKKVGIERYGETWVLQVRNSDPKGATILVNLWQEIGYQALIQARQHAITAQILQRYLYAIYSCPPPPVIGFAVPPVCQDTNALDPLALSVVNEQIQQELALSHAIQPYLIISKNSPAEIPDKPVQYDRKWFVLGGMLSFFCLAVGSLPLLQIRRQTRHETHP